MIDDNTLLRQFTADGSEAAFAELVRRHVNVVYSAALRQIGGRSALAEDVAQNVFTALARKARSLPGNVILVAWLHRATRLEAAATMRAESRRSRREQHAALMQELDCPETAPDWDALCPVLDAALDDLNDRDREAILLRFFRQHSLREVGQQLGLGEDAARMRVERALDKLRALLAKRGVTSTAAALAAALAGPAIVTAPASLAASICGVALASAAAGTISTLGILKLMASTKLKLGLAALVTGGVATTWVWQNQANGKLRTEVTALRAQSNERNSAAVAEQASTNGDADELAKLRAEHSELLRLRGEAASLRRQLQEATRLAQQNLRARQAQATAKDASEKEAADAQEEEWKAGNITRLNYTKQWLLAFILYAEKNDDQIPETFEKALEFTEGKKDPGELSGLAADQFEIVFKGSLKDAADPAKTIWFREKEARRKSDGSLWRTYGFADGHSEIHREDTEGFQKWLQERMPKPAQ